MKRLLIVIAILAIVAIPAGWWWLRTRVPNPPAHGTTDTAAAHADHAEDAHDHAAHDVHDVHQVNGVHAETPEDAHDHAAHAGDDLVALTPAQERAAAIRTVAAAPADLSHSLDLYGAISINEDRYAHILSRVPGTVVDVHARLGDVVTAGMVLAVVDSTELADAKAEYLAALEQLALEQSIFAQEEEMWKKNISPQRDFLNAKRNLAHARIALRAARQKVLSFGFSEDYLRTLPDEQESKFTRFLITAPFDGTIVEKHLTLGEVLKPDSEEALFGIADLTTVWGILRVPQKDLAQIATGQWATLDAGDGIPPAHGVIEYLGPVIGEETRTALARVAISNTAARYRPGLFVTARVAGAAARAPVCVPRDALQTVDGAPAVFVRTAHGYALRRVTPGRSDATRVEILAGVAAGEQVVRDGAFALKAHLVTSGMDAHAGHGH